MSWLLAVSMPGMLMLSTVAMQRLESVLHGDPPSACQLVARLEQAAQAARELAAQRAIDDFAATPAAPGRPRFDARLLIEEPGLPTRPNPMFRPSEFANPV